MANIIPFCIESFKPNVEETEFHALNGIVPGPGEPKDFDPYIEIVVDEVLSLNGVKVYDGYRNEQFQLQANIILQVFDYPGQKKVLKCVGKYTKIIICICHTACTMMSQLVPG